MSLFVISKKHKFEDLIVKWSSDLKLYLNKNSAIVGILLKAIKGCHETSLICAVADFKST